MSGDTVKLRLPGYGVDPDGDPVTILGLASAPELGRVTRIGANSIEYTAYPGSVGTDEFTYQITDTLGATSTGVARVSIAPPGPAAATARGAGLDDGRARDGRPWSTWSRTTSWRPGSRVTVSLVAPPARGPAALGDRPDRGRRPADGGRSQRRGRLPPHRRAREHPDHAHPAHAEGYNNPPVVSDAFGAVGDGRSVTADVLSAGPVVDGAVSGSSSGAYDPDGPFEDLVVADVYAPRRHRDPDRRWRGHRRARRPADGRAVPGRGRRRRRRHRVAVRPGGRLGPALRGAGRPDQAQAGPEDRRQALRLRHQPVGRAALVHAEEPHVALARHQARRCRHRRRHVHACVPRRRTPARVPWSSRSRPPSPTTIPRPSRPSCRSPCRSARRGRSCGVPTTRSTCPRPSRCASTSARCATCGPRDPSQVADIVWSADFDEDRRRRAGRRPGRRRRGGGDAPPRTPRLGGTGTLSVAADNSRPDRINIRVVRTPSPSLAPIRVSTLRAGESQTIDLARYLTPGVSDPAPAVVEADQLGDLPCRSARPGRR